MKDKEISIPETEECTLAHVDYETQRIKIHSLKCMVKVS